MKRVGFLLLAVVLWVSAFSQKYEIKVKINGISDTVVYLGHHFGDKKYVIDTTKIDSKGNAVFSGDKDLNKGIYIVVMPSKNMTYFEILVADQKRFSIETDTSNFVSNMKVKGCNENIVFNQYQRKMAEVQDQRMDLNKRYESAGENEEEKKKISEQMTSLNQDRTSYMDKVIAANPNNFFTKVLLAMRDIDIPEPPKDENGDLLEPDFAYKYYKKHYWDNVDFSEQGLLRTPIFEGKLNYYFDKMIVPLPDSLILEANSIINKTYQAGDTLMFRYTAGHLIYYFESSKIMGYDAVFVAIAEDWYLNGKATWADSTYLTKLAERVEKITPNMLGNIAPDLKRMQTFDDKFISLHQVEADYTVLYFYEPNCGHCKKETPKLMQEFRDTLKDINVKIFAIYTQYDREEWDKFVEEKDLIEEGWYNVWDGPYPHSNFRNLYDIYSTPVVFVLDKEKRIIGKRIGMENIKDLIEFEQKKKERETQNK